jgi:catechol 2,3-dioxygenase
MTNTTHSLTPNLASRSSLMFSHMGFCVRDLPRMARFYKEVLGFTQTDSGDLGAVQLVFLSRDPTEHHQLVLASGRPDDLTFNIINQISFRVPDLATLRAFLARIRADGQASDIQTVTHGNAVSIYVRDPEGNRLELFMDTSWYCEQPLREPLDLNQADDAILARCEAMARSRPKFQARALWQAEMARRMGQSE